jgi:hypothetical protein
LSEVIRRLDARRAGPSGPNQYFVVFCSRDSPGSGLPGHAYVVWGVEDASTGRSSQAAFGFYPQEGDELRAAFSDVPGRLVDEANNSASSSFLTARLIVQVDPVDFDDSQGQIAVWRTSTYNLFGRNCIGFAHAVASALGLFPPQPSSFDTPSEYLRELIEQTTGLSGPGQPRPEPAAPVKDAKLRADPGESFPGKGKSKAVTKILQVGATDIVITAIPPGMVPSGGPYRVLFSITPVTKEKTGRVIPDCVVEGVCICDTKSCGCDERF